MNDFAKGGKYQLAYRRCFDFHQRHQHARTLEEWQAAGEDMVSTECTQFEQAMLCAIYEEIDRNNKRRATDAIQ